MDAASSSPSAAAAAPREQPQAVSTWPRSAQLATVFLLGVATTLLSIHCCRGLRWGSQPTELEWGAVAAYRIDLNRADRAELLQVPGIGESLARRIHEYRSQHGAFQSISDLRQVQGVGPATLERLRPHFVISLEGGSRDAGSSLEIPRPSQAQRNNAAAAKKDPEGRTASSKKEMQLGERIDINQATAAELQRLPGIGPKRAQLIVEERHRSPFTSIEQLRRIPGIGPKTMEKLRPYITVENGQERVVNADGS